MTAFTIYKTNGQILKTGSCAEYDLALNVAENLFLEIASDPSNQYVKNGILLDMPPRPVGEYKFNYDAEQWEFDEQSATSIALQQRDFLLKDGPDRISPIWYDSMTQEEKTAWANYRQALLDITSQPNFPHDIIWPIKPSTGE